MDIVFICVWFIYILIGSTAGGLLGLGAEIISFYTQKKCIRISSMILNYLNIVVDVIVRLLCIPVALFAISLANVLLPSGDMHNIDGLISFMLKITTIIVIILITLKVKVPTIGKPNSLERVNTRSGVGLGVLVAIIYFCYVNLRDVKYLIMSYAKIFGFYIRI